MKVWNITCACGFDHDFPTLRAAREDAAAHTTHNADGLVFIDQVETSPAAFEDHQTGRYVTVGRGRNGAA
jgi:hypothetical protein